MSFDYIILRIFIITRMLPETTGIWPINYWHYNNDMIIFKILFLTVQFSVVHNNTMYILDIKSQKKPKN